MEAWRQLRLRQPEMFESGVRVWGQRVAYMDEIVCCYHSQLIAEEQRRDNIPGSVHQVDCFSGELCDNVAIHMNRSNNWLLIN